MRRDSIAASYNEVHFPDEFRAEVLPRYRPGAPPGMTRRKGRVAISRGRGRTRGHTFGTVQPSVRPRRAHTPLWFAAPVWSLDQRGREPLVRLFAGRGYRPAFPSGWPLSPRPPPLPEPQPPCHPPRRGMSGPRPRGGLHFSRGGGALWGLFRSGSPFCRAGRATRTRPGLLSPAQRGPEVCSPFVVCSPVRRAPQAQALFRAASCGALSPRCVLRPWA